MFVGNKPVLVRYQPDSKSNRNKLDELGLSIHPAKSDCCHRRKEDQSNTKSDGNPAKVYSPANERRKQSKSGRICASSSRREEEEEVDDNNS